MYKSTVETIAGDTLIFTWVNSGVTPSSILALLFTGSETLAHSVDMTSSGNGHYFANVPIPDSYDAYYAAETRAVIDGFTYKRRMKVHAELMQVD